MIRAITRQAGRTFDWAPRHDEASRAYAVRRLIPDSPTKSIWWAGGLVLNQGQEGSCAGHAITAEYLASPVRGKVRDAAQGHELAVSCYLRARQIDGLPDDQGEGTSINAVMKVGRERGWWDSYHWAFGAEDVKRALLLGPVVIGIAWYADMYETGPNGVVRVGGELVGGHALLVTGWSPSYGSAGEVFRWRNSWGDGAASGGGYGKGGNGYVRAGDFAKLLADDGEAAVPTGRHLGKGA